MKKILSDKAITWGLGIAIGAVLISWRYVKDTVNPWLQDTLDKTGSFFSSLGNELLSNTIPNTLIAAGLAGAYYGGKEIARKVFDYKHSKGIKNTVENACRTKEKKLSLSKKIKAEQKNANQRLKKVPVPPQEPVYSDNPKQIKKTVKKALSFFKQEKEYLLARAEQSGHLSNVYQMSKKLKDSYSEEEEQLLSMEPKETTKLLFDISKVRYNKTLNKIQNKHIQESSAMEATYRNSYEILSNAKSDVLWHSAYLDEQQSFFKNYTNKHRESASVKQYRKEIDRALEPVTEDVINKKFEEPRFTV